MRTRMYVRNLDLLLEWRLSSELATYAELFVDVLECMYQMIEMIFFLTNLSFSA